MDVANNIVPDDFFEPPGFSSILSANKKAPKRGLFIGREDGIRTHETFRFTHFPGVRLQPLGHLSINLLIVLLRLIQVLH